MTPRPVITRSYVICATPRSGSELLCEALRLTGVAGVPHEYLRRWVGKDTPLPPVTALEQIYREGTTGNGVFGIKVMWEQLDPLCRALSGAIGVTDSTPLETLAAAWPNLQWVHLSRRDTIRQAVSWSKAIRTGDWGTEPEPAAPPVYDAAEIDWCHRMVVEQERTWDLAFRSARIVPHRVVYEHLATEYEDTVGALLRFLNLPQPDQLVFEGRVLQQQSDPINEEWVDRFRRERAVQT